MGLKLTNNAVSRLASGITTTSTSISLVPGEGLLFPALAAGDYFPATLVKADGSFEIVKVTARSTDVLTVTRAQESTTAKSFSAGDRIEVRMTAGALLNSEGLTASATNAATSKATPADADEIPLVDSAASNVLKKLTWANLKATLSTIYRSIADDVSLAAGKVVIFEGTTDDAFETTLSAGNPTADRTLTLPDKTGTLATTGDVFGTSNLADSSVTTAKIADANVTTAKIADANVTPEKLSQPLTLAAKVASTSGTAIDFTGIPSWVKKITLTLASVSTNSTGHFFVRLGTSGGIDSTSTYKGCMSVTSTAVASYNFTNGFQINYNYGTSYNHSGSVVLTLLDKTTNTWVMTGETSNETFSVSFHSSGSKALSSALTQVRLTTDTGTDTFDAGSVNILYE